MQNHYVGDIGDYLKLGILRALSPGYRLGVAWWLYPDEVHDGNGKPRWLYPASRAMAPLVDPALLSNALRHIGTSGLRNVDVLAA